MSILTDLVKIPTVEAADQLYIVDTSDATDNPAGSSRRVPLSDITTTVLAKTKIQAVTDPGVAGFTFTIPSGTSRVWIEGTASSVRTGNDLDTIAIFFNGSSSQVDYFRQQNTVSNGTNSPAEAANQAIVAVVSSADSSVSDQRFVSVFVDNLEAGLQAYAVGHAMVRRDAGSIIGQVNYLDSPVTDEVTSITMISGNGDSLSGTLTCYAEKELTVLALP